MMSDGNAFLGALIIIVRMPRCALALFGNGGTGHAAPYNGCAERKRGQYRTAAAFTCIGDPQCIASATFNASTTLLFWACL